MGWLPRQNYPKRLSAKRISLVGQLFWLAGPQVAATATELVNAATQVINVIQSRAWAAIPATITTLATRATAVGTALTQMRDKTNAINISGFGPVGGSRGYDGRGGLAPCDGCLNFHRVGAGVNIRTVMCPQPGRTECGCPLGSAMAIRCAIGHRSFLSPRQISVPEPIP